MNNLPTIPKNEFKARVEKLRSVMQGNNVDMLIGFSNLLDPSAVRYLCDFSAVNESGAIIVTKDDVTVCSGQASLDYAQIVTKLDGANIVAFPEIGEVSGFEYNYEGQMDFFKIFTQIKKEKQIKKIAYLGQLIFPAIIMDKLRSVFNNVEIVNFDREFYDIRIIKSDNEIACMQKASQIISDVFENIVPKIKVGMTEREIQADFEGELIRLGGESYVQAFAPMVATGKINSYISMCRNTNRKVENGEILNLAAGVCYEGYNGIICSPYVLGDVPQKIKDAVKCAFDALHIAAQKLVIGAPAGEILNAYTEYLTKEGYIEYCPYGSLHSTGLLECEAPTFSIANGRIIKENMTICIDAYFKGMEWGSFRIEDNYVITKNGAKKMTSYNDKYLPKIFK